MQRDKCLQCVEMLLASITTKIGDDGQLSSFFFGKPGVDLRFSGAGAEIYYHDKELTLAVLYIRKHGPLYLRYLPIGEIWGLLQTFVRANYWLLADEVWLRDINGTFAKNVSARIKATLAENLAISSILNPKAELNLFPLVTITVLDHFDSPAFFLIAPDSLDGTRVPHRLPEARITPGQFPPLDDWTGRKEMVSSWLGIRSPAPRAAEKQKAAILGALALTPLPRYRHLFSGRKMFGGQCTISETVTTSFGDAHTPAMMHDIVISAADHAWLHILSEKLGRNEKSIRRQIRALEYFYRAWSLDPSERFPVLCMALDAIFGEAGSVAQAVIDGVRDVVGDHVEDARLRKIMDLRAAVIHGGAPDVYDSSKYDEYYALYGVDPIRDMELIVAHCLRDKIFSFTLKEHADPLAETIRRGQAAGRLPRRITRPSILELPTH